MDRRYFFSMLCDIMFFDQNHEGRDALVIYLDNSATTRMNPAVISVMTDVMNRVFANPSSLHRLGGQAERLVKQARQVVADSLAVLPKEIYFTSGGTESNNLAIKGTALAYHRRGRHMITTKIEHPSVYDVYEQMEKSGWEITYLPVDHYGRVNPVDVKRAMTDKTILVSVMHVNNETGTIQPIEQIGEILKEYPKVFFHVDAVQSFGKQMIHPKQMQIDLLSLSAHKLHGPKGMGALYIREGIQLSPLLIGGGQEAGLRSGTHNVPGIAGLAKAVVLADENRQQHISERQRWKRDFIEAVSQQLTDVRVNGDPSPAGGSPFVINLSFPGLKSEVIVHALEAEECYVSSKSACSSKLEKPSRVLLAMGLKPVEALGSIRISLGYDTKEKDLQKLRELLLHVIPSLQQLIKV